MASVYDYGYPTAKSLRRQARVLAGAAVPTKKSVVRPFNRAIGDVQGFTDALLALLRENAGAGAGAYDESIAAQRALDEAARGRLGALGPEYAGAAETVGARGDSALSRLLTGRAASTEYGARQPGIAAGRGALGQMGLVNARAEALTQRGEAFRQAFQQAYQQVQDRALALATTNADMDFRERQFAYEQQRDRANRRAAGRGGGGGDAGVFDDYQQTMGAARRMAIDLFNRTTERRVRIPNPDPIDRTINPYVYVTEDVPNRPSWAQAARQVRAAMITDLRALGFSRGEIDRLVRQVLTAAGFRRPKKPTYNTIPTAGSPADTPGPR